MIRQSNEQVGSKGEFQGKEKSTKIRPIWADLLLSLIGLTGGDVGRIMPADSAGDVLPSGIETPSSIG